MTTTFFDIGAALDARLNSLSGSSPIAWPNTTFRPTKGTLYLRANNLPASTEQTGLGTNGIDTHVGIYQVDVYASLGEGRGTA